MNRTTSKEPFSRVSLKLRKKNKKMKIEKQSSVFVRDKV